MSKDRSDPSEPDNTIEKITEGMDGKVTKLNVT